MARWHLAVIGLAIYLLALMIAAPATLVDAGLRRISDGRLLLAEAQGSIWSGSGLIEMRDAGGRTAVAKSIAWRILPTSLLRGHLLCEVELEHSARYFPVTLSLTRLELENADIHLPAAVLGVAVSKLAALGLTGEVSMHVASLSVGPAELRGKGTLQWRDAGSAYTPVSPLGDYELNLDADGTTAQIRLHTLQGPLQLDGNGAWMNGGRPEFIAIARVPPEHRQQLNPLLHLIGMERGSGEFELRFQ
ncbi:MAG TPA: type II secretion system protein N [Gallionella sp.]|nr:type II secretion system protein N [Gallionella sp.]